MVRFMSSALTASIFVTAEDRTGARQSNALTQQGISYTLTLLDPSKARHVYQDVQSALEHKT